MAKYLSNKELYKEIIISKAQGRLTNTAVNMIYLLGKRVITKFRYANHLDKEDCLQEGLYQAYKNWYDFDELKTDNAFSYFTEVIKRGIAFGFNKLYKKDYITGEYNMPITFSNLFSEENSEINI